MNITVWALAFTFSVQRTIWASDECKNKLSCKASSEMNPCPTTFTSRPLYPRSRSNCWPVWFQVHLHAVPDEWQLPGCGPAVWHPPECNTCQHQGPGQHRGVRLSDWAAPQLRDTTRLWDSVTLWQEDSYLTHVTDLCRFWHWQWPSSLMCCDRIAFWSVKDSAKKAKFMPHLFSIS